MIVILVCLVFGIFVNMFWVDDFFSYVMVMYGVLLCIDFFKFLVYMDFYVVLGGIFKIVELGIFDSFNFFIVGGIKLFIYLECMYFFV